MTADNKIPQNHKAANNQAISLWLFSCAALVFLMVVIGAITRLTGSGLSMVEWRPIFGALPPLGESEWNRVFDLYKASPEYAKKHFWMELGDFKQIFFWEWLHRFLGRFIGIAYGLPLLWFAIRRQIPRGYGLRFLFLLFLGGAQGFMGWYMVQSGLVDHPEVSHYRLAAHLSLAFLIFCLLLWHGITLSRKDKQHTDPILYTHAWLVMGFLIPTIFWGAYTAGLDAGLIYNEHFPKMTATAWLPPTISQFQPIWTAFFESPEGVQFIHRWLAIGTVIAILSLWAHALKRGKQNAATHAIAIFALIQMTLGIATLLSQIQLTLAVLHQMGALTLLALLIINLRKFKA